MSGEKGLFVGRSEDDFFTLSNTLNAFVDQIEHSLTAKEFKCDLTRRIHNDIIEHRFSVNRHICGNHLDLDVSAFS